MVILTKTSLKSLVWLLKVNRLQTQANKPKSTLLVTGKVKKVLPNGSVSYS